MGKLAVSGSLWKNKCSLVTTGCCFLTRPRKRGQGKATTGMPWLHCAIYPLVTWGYHWGYPTLLAPWGCSDKPQCCSLPLPYQVPTVFPSADNILGSLPGRIHRHRPRRADWVSEVPPLHPHPCPLHWLLAERQFISYTCEGEGYLLLIRQCQFSK